MPSPRYIIDKDIPIELISNLKQDQKNTTKNVSSPKSSTKITRKPVGKNENTLIVGIKGQAKIGSFLIKSPPKSNILAKPQPSNLNPNLSSQSKGRETEINTTKNKNRTKFVEDKKPQLFKTNSSLELREEPTQIIAEDDLAVSDLQIQEAKSACTPNPSRKKNTASLSLIQDFESSAETPVIHKSKFSHESTWMTPISNSNDKDDMNKIVQTSISRQIPVLLQTRVSNNEKTKINTTKVSNQTPTQCNSPLQISSTKSNMTIPATAVMSLTPSIPQLSSHRQNLKKHYESLKDQLINDALGACLEEDFTNFDPIPDPQSSITYEDGIFPNELIIHLAVVIQGSRQPLSELTATIQSKLSKFVPNISAATISSKIKVLSKRTSYLSQQLSLSSPTSTVDFYEDTNPQLLWFWELTSPQVLLPDSHYDIVKKNRSLRRKILSHFKAIQKLLSTISDPNSLEATISKEEEKVLKFEREKERSRLITKAKKEKEIEKTKRMELRRKKEAEKLLKLKEREADRERKMKEKKQKEAEKNRKEKEREEERQMRENRLRVKLEEKKKKEEEKKLKLEQMQKQKAKMMSFFNPKSSNQLNESKTGGDKNNSIDLTSDQSLDEPEFDVERFRKEINDESSGFSLSFRAPSTSAMHSRLRKTKKVPISVLISTVSNALHQSYSERRTIFVKNRLKFLFFHEDFRPPYRGTWQKKSTQVTGRRPFGKDDYLDYDIDSEGEWEEEAEDGEDVDNDENSDEEENDEEGNTREYNYHDDWLMKDDDLQGEMEDAEFARHVRRRQEKKMQESMVNICFVSPCHGGLPPKIDNLKVEGMEVSEARMIFQSCDSKVLLADEICLDPFFTTEGKNNFSSKNDTNGISSDTAKSSEMTKDEMKLFCEFVHKCSFNSKEKLIDELRAKHPDITNSRAQAIRKLDLIATKRKFDIGTGAIWEVKDEILRDLGLEIESIKPSDAINADMQTVCKFVQGCELNSKGKIVEEIHTKFPQMTLSKAGIMRAIEAVANKRKLAKGVTWDVNEDTLRELDLAHLIRVEEPSDSSINELNKVLGKDSPNNLRKNDNQIEAPGSTNLLASFLKQSITPQNKLSETQSLIAKKSLNINQSVAVINDNPITSSAANNSAAKETKASAKFLASFLKKTSKKESDLLHNKKNFDERGAGYLIPNEKHVDVDCSLEKRGDIKEGIVTNISAKVNSLVSSVEHEDTIGLIKRKEDFNLSPVIDDSEARVSPSMSHEEIVDTRGSKKRKGDGNTDPGIDASVGVDLLISNVEHFETKDSKKGKEGNSKAYSEKDTLAREDPLIQHEELIATKGLKKRKEGAVKTDPGMDASARFFVSFLKRRKV